MTPSVLIPAVSPLGRYGHLRPLGAGEHHATWVARDRDGSRVVIKAAMAGASWSGHLLEREVAIHDALGYHPSFTRLIHAHLAGAVPFLVREAVPATLASLPPSTPAFVLRSAFATALRGLAHLDACDLVHRRLSAKHVLIEWGGSARLCGFGNIDPLPRAPRARERVRSASGCALAHTFVASAVGDATWDRGGTAYARRVIGRDRPDLLRDDPILVGALDALTHTNHALRPDVDDVLRTLDCRAVTLRRDRAVSSDDGD